MKRPQETRITLFEGKHLRLKACGRWEYVERCKAKAGVVIVAVTPEDKLLLVEQYRVPVAAPVLELPAGLAGDMEHQSEEEFIAAAQRELLEETGYEAAEWEELTLAGPPSAGQSNEMVLFFRARDLRKAGKGGGEETEEITVHEVPLRQIRAWLNEKDLAGLLIDPKIFAGLFFLSLEGERFS